MVADVIKNKPVSQALNILSITNKRGSSVLLKTLRSAVANAVNNAKLKEDLLTIKIIEVGEGPFLKRYRPSTRGRVHPYKKRSSHIRIILEDKNGTKS